MCREETGCETVYVVGRLLCLVLFLVRAYAFIVDV